jgi:hypothetical protein
MKYIYGYSRFVSYNRKIVKAEKLKLDVLGCHLLVFSFIVVSLIVTVALVFLKTFSFTEKMTFFFCGLECFVNNIFHLLRCTRRSIYWKKK